MKKQHILVSLALCAGILAAMLSACGIGDEPLNPPLEGTATPEANSPNPSSNSPNTPVNTGVPDDAPKGYIEAIPFIYDDVQPFSDGVAWVKSGGRYGLIDKDGNELIRCILEKRGDQFSDGLALFGDSFIDKTGKEVFSIGGYSLASHYEEFGAILTLVRMGFSDGLLAVGNGGNWGFFDTTGNIAIPLIYDKASPFSDGLAQVSCGIIESTGENDGDTYTERRAYIDKSGNEVISFDKVYVRGIITPGSIPSKSPFSPVRNTFDNLAMVEDFDGQFAYVDRSGNVVTPFFNSEEVQPFSEDLAVICRSNAYGFIDKDGNEVIPCQYVWANNFSEGLAMVVYQGKCGFIDKSGAEVIPLIFDDGKEFGTYFSDGVAYVMLNGKGGYIDKSGNEFVPFGEYQDYKGNFSEGMAAVKLGGKWGFIAIVY